ncbi:OLC1v1006223C1 [Oldenlandia corymbosa var. corymbosa]|uniref:OLC1v1006223C1 n=1 Tax=Oldenlandia corymbosa var. corymbosa TaxID=529605 RepID=A0AAV1DH41_OLDCO|nr:OLC1v1006223C1 [Oldenlandia corymbosa var. corymbosa]
MAEDASRTLTKRYQLSRGTNKRKSKNGGGEAAADHDDDDDEDEECDPQAWETLSRSFKDAQSVLDQNRALINQVNDNHRSKVPDNLVQNVALIREINGNISKVMGIYSDLAVNFSGIVQDRRSASISAKNGGASTSTSNS